MCFKLNLGKSEGICWSIAFIIIILFHKLHVALFFVCRLATCAYRQTGQPTNILLLSESALLDKLVHTNGKFDAFALNENILNKNI